MNYKLTTTVLFFLSLCCFSQNINLPPELNANHRVAYCPLSQTIIAPNFTIIDPDDTGIESFFIQISSGYDTASDLLVLTGNHPTINSSWNIVEGKLTLTSNGGSQILYTDLELAVRDIVFESSNPAISGEKFFSFTIGDANYLPSTEHFYVYQENIGILWTEAKILAENSTYYGLQGYLATILSAEENQISAEQITGTGWIGGSDQETEGIWKWVTGPEAGMVFWNGNFTGSAPPGVYSNWNINEPNQQGNEDYAHITDNSVGLVGSWNDLPNSGANAGPFQPKGYIVEYGGTPGDPELNISASTSIYIPEMLSTTGGATCPEGTATLEAISTEGDVFWYDEDGNLLATGNVFTTPLLSSSTTYFAATSPEGCEVNRIAVDAIVHPIPNIVDPVTLTVCDDDQDGLSSFDLTTANALISVNFANETFQYYPSELDAENNTNEITNPANYTNVLDTNDVVWVRTINTNDCFRISQVNLKVTSTTIPVTFQTSFEQCDDYLDADGNDTADNDDTDGIATFDFSSVTSEIVSLFPASQTINVSYYESLVDANNLANPILNTSTYRNINSPFTQQIFIRVDNPANVNCTYVGTHITLTVNPVPEIDVIPNLDICDDANDGDDTNGFVQSIDLESQTPIILGTQDPTNFTVTYYENLIDATNGTAPLTSPYANTTADQQTIFVRVTNNTTGCFVDRLSFEVVIHPLPVITDVVELKQCDDDNDGYSFFNLNEAATDISTNFANETFVFYPTLADAQNDTNAFTDAQAIAFENRTETIDIVWTRAISEFGCYRIAQVTIIVSTTGLPATFQRSFSECDDFLDIDGNDTANNDDNDGISAFDFSSVTAEVRALFPASQQLTITYYRNQADALAELNAIADPSNYRNIGYPVTQQIYIRVDSDLDNDCLGFGPFITLTVEPVTAQEVDDLKLCDNLDDGDGFNGIVQTFNLEAQTPTILGTQDPANFTVSYHTSAEDALSGDAPIVSTTNYENTTPNLQTIYVRVTNNNSGCFTAQTSFDLIVNPLPVANFVQDLEICDDNSDGSAQNGFSQSFDLELQTATILGTQDPLQFGVSYHASLADAQAGVFPLGSPFSNSEPFSQTIYVRVYNDATGCANGISNFDVIVNPEPTTENDASNLSYCDDDMDGDDTNGFVQNIDLDGHIPEILGPLQDEDDFTVTFHETQADATAGTAPLTTPYANTTRDRQTIFVRVVNDRTQCVNDDFSFDVIINPLPDFKVTSPQIVCLSGPDLTIGIENPLTVYDYVWETPDGTNIIAEQITISSGGLYLVTATTTDGTQCSRTREILVNESIVATITDQDVTIVDDSENNSITIDPTNLGIGDYHYALINENGVQTPFQDDPVFENLEGGFYTIVVQDKNGCRPDAKWLVSVIEFPKFFTPNNDGVKDTWTIKGVNSVFFPNAQVYIFNRFGKVVAQIDVDSPGWTGTYNGKILPSDDYWFSVTLVDRNGVVRNRKGNFSLLRR